MAGRGPEKLAVTEAFLRLSLAIVLDTTAFLIWDVGTRTPLRLIAEVGAGLRKRRSLFHGSLRFATGLGLLVLGEIAIIPLAMRVGSALPLEFGALVTALITEQLIGPDLRAGHHADESTR